MLPTFLLKPWGGGSFPTCDSWHTLTFLALQFHTRGSASVTRLVLVHLSPFPCQNMSVHRELALCKYDLISELILLKDDIISELPLLKDGLILANHICRDPVYKESLGVCTITLLQCFVESHLTICKCMVRHPNLFLGVYDCH